MGDTHKIESMLSDITLGDASEEESDPRLMRALVLGQYSCQYMQACRVFLDEKCNSVERALDVFEEEEELLDLQISKLR